MLRGAEGSSRGGCCRGGWGWSERLDQPILSWMEGAAGPGAGAGAGAVAGPLPVGEPRPLTVYTGSDFPTPPPNFPNTTPPQFCELVTYQFSDCLEI